MTGALMTVLVSLVPLAAGSPQEPAGTAAPADAAEQVPIVFEAEPASGPKGDSAPAPSKEQADHSDEQHAHPPSELDERLLEDALRSLKAAPADAEEQNPLLRAGRRMRDAQARLDRPETGEETQKVQKKIIDDLDALIEHLKNCKGGSCSQCNSGRRAGAQQKQQQAKPNNSGAQRPGQKQAQQAARQAGKGRPTKEQMSLLGDLEKLPWGHLPETLREQVIQGVRQSFVQGYRELTEQYYRALAQPERRRATDGR